ncbi:hypothetical protein TI39_contig372g00023 [Zymoseptoria brevis]|uniref:Uncharacterized protein n=1 Tax=Zymoseptoria brevis TaxID=1047168 RepID=A0A0F4GQ20_9PEZI|nr:hypothetical protein TI39_contig372g00023 [Zymoseptoria brevis]
MAAERSDGMVPVTITASDLGLDAQQEIIDVLDLPQIHTKPSSKSLLSVLNDLSSEPPSWEATPRSGTPRTPLSGASTPLRRSRKVNPEGVPGYLTKIISSRLAWIEDDDTKERIWEVASQRLTERAGRSAMGDMQRCFFIPTSPDSVDEGVDIVLHEPSLTEDNLGLKTWASSYLLAKRMATLRDTLPLLPDTSPILELGAGTGLVGLATAVILQRHVVLTDLPEIVPNLQRNATANTAVLDMHGASVDAAVLDWTDPGAFRLNDTLNGDQHLFPLILAADPIYSSDHPRWLVQAIGHHLSRGESARVVIEMPLRDTYSPERQDFRDRMQDLGLTIAEEGEEVGFDDWSTGNGEELSEVRAQGSLRGSSLRQRFLAAVGQPLDLSSTSKGKTATAKADSQKDTAGDTHKESRESDEQSRADEETENGPSEEDHQDARDITRARSGSWTWSDEEDILESEAKAKQADEVVRIADELKANALMDEIDGMFKPTLADVLEYQGGYEDEDEGHDGDG